MIRSILRAVVPRSLVDLRNRRIEAKLARQFLHASNAEIFDTIYRKRLWGRGHSSDFHSGPGSHDAATVSAYLTAVGEFLSALQERPTIVDLGCGDFNIGAKLRIHAIRYIACDVVPSLIERNKSKFAHSDVDFRVVDITQDPLPTGDIVFVRQVFQHLSNRQIAAVLPKLHQYRWAIITEHLPKRPHFAPNLDKPVGADTRLNAGSGVVLDKAPFALECKRQIEICSHADNLGVIKTIAFEMASL